MCPATPLEQHSRGQVIPIGIEIREQRYHDNILEALEKATDIFIIGGNQLRLMTQN